MKRTGLEFIKSIKISIILASGKMEKEMGWGRSSMGSGHNMGSGNKENRFSGSMIRKSKILSMAR